jgi:hypothetical protein
VGLPLICVSPLLIAAAHHAALPMGAPSIPSHDTLGLQLERLLAPGPMGREATVNLGRFLGCPLGWLSDAWGTLPIDAFDPLRSLGLAVALLGTGIEWRDRTVSAPAALLRYLSVAVPLQIAALWAVNHDLHHLAQATVPLALWAALGADRVAALVAPPRSWLRACSAGLFCLPMVWSGASTLLATDTLVRTAKAHLFTEDGQVALAELVTEAGATEVVTTSYEAYGMLDERLAGVRIVHAWGAVAADGRDPEGLRRLAEGGYYLSVRGSAPFVYDWRATGVGTLVGAVGDRDGNWAELYRVGGAVATPDTVQP